MRECSHGYRDEALCVQAARSYGQRSAMVMLQETLRAINKVPTDLKKNDYAPLLALVLKVSLTPQGDCESHYLAVGLEIASALQELSWQDKRKSNARTQSAGSE